MESPGAVGRRRGTSRSNVEDQALDQIAKEVSPSIYSSFLSNTNLPIFALFSIRHRVQTEWYAAKKDCNWKRMYWILWKQRIELMGDNFR